MPTDLFELYDAEISDRLSKGKILMVHDAERASYNGTLIKVSAYTREDGTYVEGYYRRKPNI